MIGKEKRLAPEPYFTAYLFVLRQAILMLRMWHRYDEPIQVKQTEDLMDAIHNISELLYCYGGWHVHDNVLEDLLRYDRKWASTDSRTGRSLAQILERAISDVEANGRITEG